MDYSSTAALTLNGGTIDDAAGNAADLTLPATGTDGLAAQNITINSPSIISDLGVSMTSSSATSLIGGSVSYTITVTNSGPDDAQGVSLTDMLPASLTFGVQTQTSGSTFTLANSGNTITDTIATLASGASATITVVADVNQNIAAGAVIANTATVSSTTLDTNAANNTATANTTSVLSGVMLTTDPFDATKTELVVAGTNGNDNISFILATGGMVKVNMNGQVLPGPIAVTGRIVAMGQAGNDVITVGSNITLPAFLYSGTGTDQLSGGGGNNVLVGGGGADTLIGGAARNILISGSGASKLYASKLGVVGRLEQRLDPDRRDHELRPKRQRLGRHHAGMGLRRRLCHAGLQDSRRHNHQRIRTDHDDRPSNHRRRATLRVQRRLRLVHRAEHHRSDAGDRSPQKVVAGFQLIRQP